MYRVLVHFKDIQDSYFEYNPGDTFPRKGLQVRVERIMELSSSDNRKGKPVIELIKDEKPIVKATEPNIPEPVKEPEPIKAEEPKKVEKKVEEPMKPKRGRKKKDA